MSQSGANHNNILIVDDTPENLTMLTQMLTQKGFLVRPAINGEIALKTIQKVLPDLILLDIMMPDMDGYEVCQHIKADEHTRDIPVLFISALDETLDKVKAFDVGGVDYITKPFQEEEVLARVETHLKLRDSQKRLQEKNFQLQQELTERKRAEELLRKLEKAIETTEVGITITNKEGRIEYINPADAKMHGYTVDEVIGQRSHIFTLPEFREKDPNMLQDGKDLPYWKRERINIRKDGSVFPVKLISNPIYNKYEELVGKVTICEDITERKHAERSLQESEKRYRSIFENVTSGIFQATLDGKFITANPALARMLGYASVQELFKTVTNIAEQLYVEPRHWYEIADMIQITRETANVETRYRYKDGGEIIVNLNIWAVYDENDEPGYFEGIIENITERKQMEGTLFRQTTLLHSVAGAMNCLLVNADFRTAITQVLELLGFVTEADRVYIFENHPHQETDEILMSQRFEWVKDVSEAQIKNSDLQNLSYYPQFSRWYETLKANKAIRGLIREFPLSEQAILEAQNILSMIMVPIMIRDQFWGFIGFDDCHTERQWREEEESILFAMAGSIGGAIARQQAEDELIDANTELTETLEDLKRTQTQLVQSEKMAALGQLIAGVAHEINTPLGAIRSSIQDISTTLNQTLKQLPAFFHSLSEERQQDFFALLKQAQNKDVTLSSRERRKSKRMLAGVLKKHQVQNARKIADTLVDMGVDTNIHQFLPLFQDPEHARILKMAYEVSGLQESTNTIMTATDRASKVVFALKTYARYDQSGEKIKADIKEGLETVLTLYYNQLKHGIKVIRHYEELQPILCYPDELNQVWTNLIHNALQAMNYKGTLTVDIEKRDNQAVVSITDTGTGIPEDIKEKIFEPFFTTKPAGEGSGLGLDIVKQIVEKHQGTITVESEPGNTTFHVWLPS
jgi:PAS domain S-box-containing protein